MPKVSVNAGHGNARNILFRVVTHPNGVNIRDKNCNIIRQVGYGQVLTSIAENFINSGCSMGGEKNMEMANYGIYDEKLPTDVSTRYTRAVNSGTNGTFTTQGKVRVNNPNGGGVNLRNIDCKKITTLPNGTYSENSTSLSEIFKICKAGNEFYAMIYFVHNGETEYVAEVLTKFE